MACAIAAAMLAGCGSNGLFRDRGFEYLRAEIGKPLVYPDGIKPVAAQELYPVPGVEQRRRIADGEKPELEIPPPPQLVDIAALTAPSGASPAVGSRKVTVEQVNATRDGNGYPVLMLTLDFDWAWQVVGDALKATDGVEVVDLDREQAAYFIAVNGKRTSAGEPYQLKLNYTANGIQVALQIDDDAMAPRDIASGLMERLRSGLLK
jgi:uncharacterized lipoprotein